MRNLILFVFVATATTYAYEITCHYDTNTDWWAINDVYFCDLENDLDLTKNDDVTTAVNGVQQSGKSNADVKGFRAYNTKVHLFPKGLEKFFNAEEIEFIAIWSAGLKEIHQSDLSPFTKMRILSLWDNDFDVIEKDLLKFNPNIEYIGLGKNKIKFVDGNVFGHLKNLHSLHIDGNQCVSRQAAGDRNEVLDIEKEISEKCNLDSVVKQEIDFIFDVRVDV